MKFLLFTLGSLLVARLVRSRRTVLFLCTGNYYRSRLAEAVFNHEAERRGLRWRASSRGLNVAALTDEMRRLRLSPYTAEKLRELGIGPKHGSPDPRALTRRELRRAAHVVALCEREHRPYLEADFAPLDRLPLTFWNIDDIDFADPATALPEITARVRDLVARAAEGRPLG